MDRGQEIRELKLGASFTNPNSRQNYHTLKFDFKPASVDAHKEATLETGTNNQVTVTVPHLDGAGTPNTIFKGNQRDYTKKECVLIFNRETNEIILEKLSCNITVKKTRADTSNKTPQQPPPQQQLPQPIPPAIVNAPKVENQTARHSSKTKVSTGIRKNANVLNFVPLLKHSPLQGSPSYPHKSPQGASAWNANNNTSTLPSIPSLLDDNFSNNQQSQPYIKNGNSSSAPSSSMLLQPKASSAISNQQQQQIQQQQQQQMVVDDIGVLSTSESSSDSNDSDSDSDSGESVDNHAATMNSSNNINNGNVNLANHRNNNISNSNSNNINTNSNHKKGNHMDNTALLRNDLCLSDSNSDSDDF